MTGPRTPAPGAGPWLAPALDAIAVSGIAYIPEDGGFFTPEEWDRIAAIVESPRLPFEHVLIGDAGETNNVRVGRFLTDVERPRLVNEPLASQLLAIIHSPHKAAFYQALLGGGEAVLRRAQVNILGAGNYIGFHLDTDSNPDYGFSIVLQLGTRYGGGDFVAYDRQDAVFSARPAHRSVLITRSDIPHEVKAVTEGQRVSLVYFVSARAGDNRRDRGEAGRELAEVG